ncbi:hypothetical protein AJ78_08990 [Emergomyces pasteurianus Ep9510]|uniref:Uncharacterized protein n=1 Tax=Emergomyces pasteurianus Ep9510 TaxID=1447872 RepID=A0A1J9P1F1_9EURO|nr:hypothetical protein AJ78_08990 [Emergomyces pasteurianus Ep9510]
MFHYKHVTLTVKDIRLIIKITEVLKSKYFSFIKT